MIWAIVIGSRSHSCSRELGCGGGAEAAADDFRGFREGSEGLLEAAELDDLESHGLLSGPLLPSVKGAEGEEVWSFP